MHRPQLARRAGAGRPAGAERGGRGRGGRRLLLPHHRGAAHCRLDIYVENLRGAESGVSYHILTAGLTHTAERSSGCRRVFLPHHRRAADRRLDVYVENLRGDENGLFLKFYAQPYTLNTRNKKNNTGFYSYLACFVKTFTLNMYVSMSCTGLIRRNTLFVFLWSRHRNMWIYIQHVGSQHKS